MTIKSIPSSTSNPNPNGLAYLVDLFDNKVLQGISSGAMLLATLLATGIAKKIRCPDHIKNFWRDPLTSEKLGNLAGKLMTIVYPIANQMPTKTFFFPYNYVSNHLAKDAQKIWSEAQAIHVAYKCSKEHFIKEVVTATTIEEKVEKKQSRGLRKKKPSKIEELSVQEKEQIEAIAAKHYDNMLSGIRPNQVYKLVGTTASALGHRSFTWIERTGVIYLFNYLTGSILSLSYTSFALISAIAWPHVLRSPTASELSQRPKATQVKIPSDEAFNELKTNVIKECAESEIELPKSFAEKVHKINMKAYLAREFQKNPFTHILSDSVDSKNSTGSSKEEKIASKKSKSEKQVKELKNEESHDEKSTKKSAEKEKTLLEKQSAALDNLLKEKEDLKNQNKLLKKLALESALVKTERQREKLGKKQRDEETKKETSPTKHKSKKEEVPASVESEEEEGVKPANESQEEEEVNSANESQEEEGVESANESQEDESVESDKTVNVKSDKEVKAAKEDPKSEEVELTKGKKFKKFVKENVLRKKDKTESGESSKETSSKEIKKEKSKKESEEVSSPQKENKVVKDKKSKTEEGKNVETSDKEITLKKPNPKNQVAEESDKVEPSASQETKKTSKKEKSSTEKSTTVQKEPKKGYFSFLNPFGSKEDPNAVSGQTKEEETTVEEEVIEDPKAASSPTEEEVEEVLAVSSSDEGSSEGVDSEAEEESVDQ